jgi:D-sedoheptulose 7-phosphate isomerase
VTLTTGTTGLYDDVDAHAELLAQVRAMVPSVAALGERLCEKLAAGGTLYTCGNGGSAADAQHLAAELLGRYLRERRGLRSVALTTDPSVVTCIANDYHYAEVFARQVTALAGPGDVVAGFTTSGRSPSVVRGLAAARERGATTVLFTGAGGEDLAAEVDHPFVVPSKQTARVQEMHVLLLHLVSEYIDRWAAAG